MKSTTILTILVMGLMFCIAQVIEATSMGTAWTYQGRLLDVNDTADGEYDFEFKLYDDPNANFPLAEVNIPNVDVINGYFTVNLDFGSGIFDGNSCWLEIFVRPGELSDPNDYKSLSPRREVTPTPYALYAAKAGTDADWIVLQQNMHASVSGNVGIGVMIPGYKLDVGGDIKGTTGRFGTDQLAFGANLQVANKINIMDDSTDNPNLFIGDNNMQFLQLRWDSTGDHAQLYTPAPYNIALMPGGNVGIGTTTPEAGFDVANPSGGPAMTVGRRTGYPSIRARSDAAGGWLIIDSNGAGNVGLNHYDDGHVILVNGGGRVGIGTTGPDAKLSIQMQTGTQLMPAVTPGLVIKDGQFNSAKQVDVQDSTGESRFVINGAGKVGIATDSPQSELDVAGKTRTQVLEITERVGIGTDNPQLELDVVGRTRTKVLEITGGGDLAEPFNVSGQQSGKPGMVVCIDPENPGNLVVSKKTYDRTVAGIISGAGGVKPGMLMGQVGTRADGEHPVAMTGRVYCRADASNGAIRPGDLLTTSQTPGHAMKVTDYDRANGAILGKAMTGLEAGQKGLVLVLVALQ
ncbi:MAG: hypothetical protein GWN67_02630 [Phycisphaerae bacterium]|nr:hypothetical protein [Phycisphaerae bacterium]NIP52091.1 hypothetical protein [Phycisphaerae bacterium]NIS50056.1 hypothetical protein [Phycisphaerae bacterium]NIU10311.1 hypothetical protein [Phycisphaerae bacterium]NIU55322.1 hypothetical protein [Phycisphaerae bacterium]